MFVLILIFLEAGSTCLFLVLGRTVPEYEPEVLISHFGPEPDSRVRAESLLGVSPTRACEPGLLSAVQAVARVRHRHPRARVFRAL